MSLLVKEPQRQPPLVSILAAAANVAHRFGVDLRVTDTIGNGRHGAWSLHYSLRAADFGSKEFDAQQKETLRAGLRGELAQFFSGHCDVLLEGEGTENEHFHVEFDPK